MEQYHRPKKPDVFKRPGESKDGQTCHKNVFYLFTTPLPQKIHLYSFTLPHPPLKNQPTPWTKWSFWQIFCSSFFFLHLSGKIFSFFSRKVFNGQYPPNFPIWERATSPKMRLPSIARSHFCAAEPGKVWHLLVITRHIFKLWKCGLGAQPGMNMIGEEDYKTRNARSFLFWPGWLNLSCLFEYHKLKGGQWYIW